MRYPAGEYDAARTNAVVMERADRCLIRVHGRDPIGIVHNIVTNDVKSIGPDAATYAALLTPKGRMIADLRIIRRTDDVLLECDVNARDALVETWKKSVPPLFARQEDVSDAFGVLGVYGPAAASLLSNVVGGEAIPADSAEYTHMLRDFGGERIRIITTRETGDQGFDVIAPAGVLAPLSDALRAAGAQPMGHAMLDVLRIEAGRPRWGAELTPDTIPLEAGLLERAINMKKGCYTGQEVIIRILHRGHVNWLLRGLLLGTASATPADATLVRPGETKTVGRITSTAESPRFGQTIALGYVRREIEPPATLHLNSPDGPEVQVVALPFDTDTA